MTQILHLETPRDFYPKDCGLDIALDLCKSRKLSLTFVNLAVKAVNALSIIAIRKMQE